MKKILSSLLILVAISISVTVCANDKLDKLQKNIEQLRDKLPKKNSQIGQTLLDVEFDRENKRVIYIFDSYEEDIASEKQLRSMVHNRYYMLYMPMIIDPKNAALIIESNFNYCFRNLNKDHTQEINTTILPYMFGDLEKLTSEETELGVVVEYEEGKVSPNTYVLKFNSGNYITAKYQEYLNSMLKKGVELTDDQKGHLFSTLYYFNEFPIVGLFENTEFKSLSDEVIKEINETPRKEFIYPYLEAIDEKYFVLYVPLKKEFMDQMNQYKTDEEFHQLVISSHKKALEPYYDRLQNIEMRFVDSEGEVIISEKLK